jgi:hypothetical protein
MPCHAVARANQKKLLAEVDPIPVVVGLFDPFDAFSPVCPLSSPTLVARCE